MQLTCPNCGEAITSENINIQHMAAVCPACATVFQFALPETKAKRRKVKQPRHLKLWQEGQRLHMAFRTNFRLDRNEAFLSTLAMSFFATFMTLIFTDRYFTRDLTILLPLGFALVTVLLYYGLALIAFNKTHIEMDDETISVSRKPLPGLFRLRQQVGLSGVVAIRHEETPISRQEGYDTPRYRVWAEMPDGSRKLIVNDATDDYALFIAQRLNEHLNTEADLELSHLMDVEQTPDAEPALETFIRNSLLDN